METGNRGADRPTVRAAQPRAAVLRAEPRVRPLRDADVPPGADGGGALARAHRGEPLPRRGDALRLQRPAGPWSPPTAASASGPACRTSCSRSTATGADSPLLCNIYLPVDSFLLMSFVGRLQVALLSGAIVEIPAELCGPATVDRWYADYRSGSFERVEVVKMELNAAVPPAAARAAALPRRARGRPRVRAQPVVDPHPARDRDGALHPREPRQAAQERRDHRGHRPARELRDRAVLADHAHPAAAVPGADAPDARAGAARRELDGRSRRWPRPRASARSASSTTASARPTASRRARCATATCAWSSDRLYLISCQSTTRQVRLMRPPSGNRRDAPKRMRSMPW